MADKRNDDSMPAQQSDSSDIGSNMSDDVTGAGEDERIRGVGDEGDDDDFEEEGDEAGEEEEEDGSF